MPTKSMQSLLKTLKGGFSRKQRKSRHNKSRREKKGGMGHRRGGSGPMGRR